MTRRLQKTLADYVTIAISPVLIMGLVGSLLFFLVEVFYQGRYEGRLDWIAVCFTVAIVLVGRIAIEEGKDRARMFAAPLAIVTYLALWKFVEFTGGPLAGVSWIANMLLLGIVWWSAHKLTWDCTFIDDQEDASGQGLLETVGLDPQTTGAAEPQVGPADEPEGVTSKKDDDGQPGWWQRLFSNDDRRHASGVWIVYFSLAALPIFGFGQLLVPRDNVDSRRRVFLYLFVYVASALGLLLTTPWPECGCSSAV
ncbi:MAG: hypothetical protein ACYTG0_17395 [Planctomycetota bacterium]|jgi:hypothetical protein